MFSKTKEKHKPILKTILITQVSKIRSNRTLDFQTNFYSIRYNNFLKLFLKSIFHNYFQK